MGVSKTAIYSGAVIFAMVISGSVKAQGTPNKGVSGIAPGHTKPPGTSAKGVAPGQIKLPGESAKSVAPGQSNPNKKK
jgi:hypothetical protein